MSKFGNYLKERRRMLKLTQKDLAEMSGISERTIYKIENGIGDVTFETMEKLCKILGLEIVVKPINL